MCPAALECFIKSHSQSLYQATPHFPERATTLDPFPTISVFSRISVLYQEEAGTLSLLVIVADRENVALLRTRQAAEQVQQRFSLDKRKHLSVLKGWEKGFVGGKAFVARKL